MDRFQREILKAVASHDGEFSWYQLDRTLTNDSTDGGENVARMRGLLRALRGLEEAGFIASGAGHNPSQPLYSITAKGRHTLDVLVAAPADREGR